MLRFSVQNLRFTSNTTAKPLVIVTPLEVPEIQATIICSQRHDMQIRVRSGGHDYEGMSYVSEVPFVVIDLINFREIQVDVENSNAWVQGGATVGELLYKISQQSRTLSFPAGVCPTVGISGLISGGGYGFLMRKYGLSADNILDAHIIDVNGRVLDRESMGEDLFWAIRGGGGASFGVIIAWKIKLVHVPSTVTLFNVFRTLEQNATNLIHKWQLVANKLDGDLNIRIILERVNSSAQTRKLTVKVTFESLFLGGVDRLIPLMQEEFPELGLVREDCTEMSWIESVLYLAGFTTGQPLEVLLSRTHSGVLFFKAKSDYVRDSIPNIGFEGLWPMFYEDEAKRAVLILTPYGGRMDEILEMEIPFPHRAGNIYQIQHLVFWHEEGDEVEKRHINWIRRLYSYMEPFVSKSPRAAYVNYRDLDIGVNNNNGYTSYKQASIWGLKYFKNNFKKLVKVKTSVDPLNFFRNEQSIPSLSRFDNITIEHNTLPCVEGMQLEFPGAGHAIM
ncbi:reticuline oxidase-like protein [Trifolium pratense]|uniref:Reticuline oxidase-like protein n=1 Tax=Trifolium pratense TaxID=57577 RepID=A0A2K3N2M6_TRIPR|nr:reticuline oxidase-like protein [Trifolium pratense]PNY17690.1 reticuline oxidase-like protein [Trifolium pratense]